MAPSACHLGGVPDFSDLAVGYRVDRVVCFARFRNFYGARIPRTPEVSGTGRIADISAVDNHSVVVKAGCQRSGCGGPEYIQLHQHGDFWGGPEVQSDLGRLGSLDSNLHPALMVHPGIVRAPYV